MDKEEIIRMAREAGWSGIYTQWREPDGSPDWTPVKESLTVPVTMEQIERFASLVAAAERAEVERLKLLCEEMLRELYVYRASEYLRDVTAAIRARGNK